MHTHIASLCVLSPQTQFLLPARPTFSLRGNAGYALQVERSMEKSATKGIFPHCKEHKKA
jgi:hypothetical protein